MAKCRETEASELGLCLNWLAAMRSCSWVGVRARQKRVPVSPTIYALPSTVLWG